MPQISLAGVDSTALMALGFLVIVLALTLGLFGWLFVSITRKPRS